MESLQNVIPLGKLDYLWAKIRL